MDFFLSGNNAQAGRPNYWIASTVVGTIFYLSLARPSHSQSPFLLTPASLADHRSRPGEPRRRRWCGVGANGSSVVPARTWIGVQHDTAGGRAGKGSQASGMWYRSVPVRYLSNVDDAGAPMYLRNMYVSTKRSTHL